MVKSRAFFALLIASALTVPGAVVAAAKDSPSSSGARGSIATDHIPQFDGPMSTFTGPDGRTWATWAYRASGEFDIAVSSRDASAATWNTPIFFGRRSGIDEIDPAIAFDSQGATYIAFATTRPPRVAVAMLAAGSIVWSAPVIVSGTEVASSPALLLVGDRLIVAYRTPRGVGMIDLPTVGTGNQVNGISDGPDGVDPLGAKDGLPLTGPLPISSSTPVP